MERITLIAPMLLMGGGVLVMTIRSQVFWRKQTRQILILMIMLGAFDLIETHSHLPNLMATPKWEEILILK